MLQIRKESIFIQARRKEMKLRVRVGGEKREIFRKFSFSLCIITFQLCPNSSLVFLALSLIVTSEVESSQRKNGSKGFIPKGVNTSPRVCWSYTRLGDRNLFGPQPILLGSKILVTPHITELTWILQVKLHYKLNLQITFMRVALHFHSII